NQLHGSAFEFNNNQHFNSRAFFQAAGTPKPLNIYNNFGGTIGGPIKKNKLFYFLSFDGTRQRQARPRNYPVPTPALKNVHFSALYPVSSDPNPGAPDGSVPAPFAGNVIPSNRIDSIAQKIQSYYPSPNQGGPSAFAKNYFASGGPILSRNYFDA